MCCEKHFFGQSRPENSQVLDFSLDQAPIMHHNDDDWVYIRKCKKKTMTSVEHVRNDRLVHRPVLLHLVWAQGLQLWYVDPKVGRVLEMLALHLLHVDVSGLGDVVHHRHHRQLLLPRVIYEFEAALQRPLVALLVADVGGFLLAAHRPLVGGDIGRLSSTPHERGQVSRTGASVVGFPWEEAMNYSYGSIQIFDKKAKWANSAIKDSVNKNRFFAPKHLRQTLLCPFEAKSSFLSEMIQKGPYGPKRVSCRTPGLAILVPFGPLWNVKKPAMFGHFWSKMDHFWAIPSHEPSTPE